MSDNSRIEWCDATWNPVTGCSPVSSGCQNCYAKRHARRMAGQFGYPEAPHHFDVTLHPDRLADPLHYRRPRRIFVCSMGDLFHEEVPNQFIDRVLQITQRAPMLDNQTFIVLTKRPVRLVTYTRIAQMREDRASWLGAKAYRWPPANVWFGFSAEDQETFDERWSQWQEVESVIHVVSLEPLLAPIVLPDDFLALRHHAWCITGGETGPNARPSHPAWFRSVRDQCLEARVPFFFKQWGSCTYQTSCEVSGRLLDGQEWNQFPA